MPARLPAHLCSDRGAAPGRPERRSTRAWRGGVGALLLALVVGLPGRAGARVEESFDYPFEEVWSSAVRMLRVDLRFPVTDKDKDNGFLLFEYEDRGRRVPGSLEVFPERSDRGGARDDEGGRRAPRVRVTVQVPAMPSYVERMLVDRLERKLEQDWGAPIPPARRTPDGDDDGGDDGEEEQGARVPRSARPVG